MLVQIYFSVTVEPQLTPGQIADFYRATAGNMHYPIGNVVSGRMLCRALVDDTTIERAESLLNNAGKRVIICGVFDKAGNRIPGFTYTPSEYGFYFAPVETEDGPITPPTNTAAGWSAPNV